MCCGAGGANAFVEDKTNTRISTLRTQEVIATGACALATACPFCTIMLDEVSKQELEERYCFCICWNLFV